MHRKYDEPHSPCITGRETEDGGFSKGLGLHFQPNEEYWLDCHNHLEEIKTTEEINLIIDQWFSKLDAYRLGKIAGFGMDPAAFSAYGEMSREDPRFTWLVRISDENPDPLLFRQAIDHGAVGLKLHNARIIMGKAPHDIWLSDEWMEMFRIAEKHQMPVIWHVTQRMGASPYHGGDELAYWKTGFEQGVKFTNEDLLQVSLEVLRRFPRLKLIGAHQIHIGLERLSSLFDQFENLYIDTSCTFFLRWEDYLYEQDRRIYRDFCHKYQDRILFGSDSALSIGVSDYLVQAFLGHIRFIKQLRLEDGPLQKISHLNAERLFKLDKIKIVRKGYVRP